MGQALGGALELIRPLNGLMASAAVLVGAFVSRSPTRWMMAVVAAGATFAAASGANALNDSLDRDTDAVNRPGRPVPSGRVTPGAAAAVSAVLFTVALGLAAAVSGRALGLAAGWLVLTALYSKWLKGVPIAGNVAVAAVACTPFLMGGFSQGKFLLAMIPTSIAFLLHLAREIVKDVEDAEGDRAAGVRTLAVRRGPAAAYAAARTVLVLMIVAAVVPIIMRVYGWGYVALLVPIDALLIRAMLVTAPDAGRQGASRFSATLKVVMVLGLAAFVAGTL